MMYNKNRVQPTSIKINETYEGESLEKKIQRLVNNKEPLTDSSPLIYQERSDGIQAAYDIRTDRFEIAVEAMDYVTRSHIAKRENKPDVSKDAPPEVKDEAIKGMAKETKG